MSQRKEAPPLSLQDVKDWTLGKADDRVKTRIEDDLKRPDSEVREYLEWVAAAAERPGGPVKHPTPKIVQRDLEDVFRAAGGPRAFTERFRRATEGRDGGPGDLGR
jgi:hypothetical protein